MENKPQDQQWYWEALAEASTIALLSDDPEKEYRENLRRCMMKHAPHEIVRQLLKIWHYET
jgi:hypothetical protein